MRTRFNLPPWLKWVLGVVLVFILFVGGLVLWGAGRRGAMIFLLLTVVPIFLFAVLYVCWLFVLQPSLKSAKLRKWVDDWLNSHRDATGQINEADLKRLHKKWESGMQACKQLQLKISNMPWYLIVGPAGSGKTEGIRRGNLPLIAQEFSDVKGGAVEADISKGKGGTELLDFWFTTDAVLIDTAGKLADDRRERGLLEELLALLQKARKLRPVNGLLLIVPADSLLTKSEEYKVAQADALRESLDIVKTTLHLRFPVYVVVTKCDLLNGFREFFERIGNPELQHQILGWSNNDQFDSPFSGAKVRENLDRLAFRLRQIRLGLLQNLSPTRGGLLIDEVDELYALPQSFDKLAGELITYLERIFCGGGPQGLLFRGVYFTSAMRNGEELELELATKLGLQLETLRQGRQWEERKAYFWRDLMVEKVFLEKKLVTDREDVLRWLHLWRWNLFLFGAVLLFVWVAAAFLLKEELRGSIKEQADLWHQAAKGWTAAPTNWSVPRLWYPIASADAEPRYNGGTAGFPVKDYTLLDFHNRLRNAAEKNIQTPWVFGLAKRVSGEDLKPVQVKVAQASIVYPIIGAARSKMQDGKSNPGNPKRLEEAIMCLVRLETAGWPNQSNPELETAKIISDLAAYVWSAEVIRPTNILYSLSPFAQKHAGEALRDNWDSSGKTLDSNMPIAAGLNQLEKLLSLELKFDVKKANLRVVLNSLSNARNSELSLISSIPKNEWKRFYLEYKSNYTALESSLANTDGILNGTTNSLQDAIQSYNKQELHGWTNSFQALFQQVTTVAKKERLSTDVASRLEATKTSLQLLEDQASQPGFDGDFLSATTPSGLRLFQVRETVYRRLQLSEVRFPFVSPDGSANFMDVGDVKQLCLTLTYLTKALNGSAYQYHTKQLTPWRTALDKLSPIAKTLVDTKGEIRTCKITLLGKPGNSTKWRRVAWYGPKSGDHKLKTEVVVLKDVNLGDYNVNEKLNFTLMDTSIGSSKASKELDFGNWSVVNLLYQHKPATIKEWEFKSVGKTNSGWTVAIDVIHDTGGNPASETRTLLLEFVDPVEVTTNHLPGSKELKLPDAGGS